MESEVRDTSAKNVTRRSLGRKVLDLVCCHCTSTTSPIDDTGNVFEESISNDLQSTFKTVASKPPPEISQKYSHLTESANSLVTFLLQSLQDAGSNLPGIGAVGIVLRCKEKLELAGSNQDDIEDLLEYVEGLCKAASLTDMKNVSNKEIRSTLIGHLRNLSVGLEDSSKRKWASRVLNAEAIEEKLKAVWKGIDMALGLFSLQIASDTNDKVSSLVVDQIDRVIARLKFAEGAMFNSLELEKKCVKSCYEGTRETILAEIKTWALGTDDSHIFWLSGLAGTGKSTIATSIAEWADQDQPERKIPQKFLGASFFFARDMAELRDVNYVFTTLARQLARFDKSYKEALYHELQDAGADDPSGLKLTLQFEHLIRRPLDAYQGDPILIILDALDECSNETLVRKIIDLFFRLHTAVDLPKPKLRILITSRPNDGFRNEFASEFARDRHSKLELHNIDDQYVRKDIQTYLELEFAKIVVDSSRFGALPSDWPQQEEFITLLENCGKLFAYAATAIRFITDEYVRDPTNQLKIILSNKKDNRYTKDPAFVDLDNLYSGILRYAAEKAPHKEEIIQHIIATIVCLREPFAVDDLAAFLSVDAKVIRDLLRLLQSAIIFPSDTSDTTPIRIFHTSFLDFMRNRNRGPDSKFVIDFGRHEYFMALRCMDETGRIYFAREIQRIKRYSVRYWSSHLRAVPPNHIGTCRMADDSQESSESYNIPAGQLELENLPTELSEVEESSTKITEEGVLESIQSWANNEDNKTGDFLRMSGLEGAGTTSLALITAKWARKKTEKRNYLSGSFFFVRGILELNSSTVVVPTLASQFASANIQYRLALYDALQRHDGIEMANLERQFEILIRTPLSESREQRPLIVILDSLDECHPDLNVKDMLYHLHCLKTVASGSRRIRIIFTCRPKAVEQFDYLPKDVGAIKVLEYRDVGNYTVSRFYIDAFLKREFKKISGGDSLLEGEAAKDSAKLLELCGASYAFATAVVRFISEESDGKDYDTPPKRLKVVLRFMEIQHAEVINGNTPLNFDVLYLGLLQNALERDSLDKIVLATTIRCIIATMICLRDLLPLRDLSQFMRKDVVYIRNALRYLHSVVRIPVNDESKDPVAFFNPSFPDFIQDPSRCTDERFQVNVDKHQYYMAMRCMDALADTTSPHAEAHKYSAKYWPYHIEAASSVELPDELAKKLLLLATGETTSVAMFGFVDDSFKKRPGGVFSFLRLLVNSEKCRFERKRALLEAITRCENSH